jgi:hypothetical protein
MRSIHASQFLYHVWRYTNSKEINVFYYTNENSLLLEASTTNEICEKISTGEKKFTYLSENIKFKIHS